MPDLDLIKQGKQGYGRLARPIRLLERVGEDRNQCGRFAADLLQEQQTARRRFNDWL